MGFGSQWLDSSFFGGLGLLIGSFLNVVIYRLPKMLERQWAAECSSISGQPVSTTEVFNLAIPRSKCPNCNHQIRWYENIPVVSYFALRGACSSCKTTISLRYPAVEAATGLLFFVSIWQWGVNATGLAWCVFSAILLALALIDWDTTLLPDDLTLPLLWMGLIASALQWTPTSLQSALWGAVGGYLSLWSVYWLFKLVTGKEGMGYGDFKLLAALGAWFGWQALIPIILISSVFGAIVGIAMKFTSGLREGGYIPFGPFLAGAGLAALLWGPTTLMRTIGL
jgi:leader peptidase (prepilin peptidase)/N-methyltransferase